MKTQHMLRILSVCALLYVSCSKEIASPTIPTHSIATPVRQYEALRIDPEKTELSSDDAIQVSKLFMCSENPVKATRSAFAEKAVEETFPIVTAEGEPLAYVVNFGGGGYSIVSATKKYAPILAFSDKGRITRKNLEGNGIACWVSLLTSDIVRTKKTLAEDSPEYAKTRSLWSDYEKTNTLVFAATYPMGIYYWYLQTRNLMMSTCGDANANRTDFYYKAQTYGTYYNSEAEESRRKEMDHILSVQFAGQSVPPCFVWGEGATNGGQAIETKVMPLLKTYWDQNSPYNSLMPPSEPPYYDPKKYAGCVAIAVAQLINYYNYPTIVDGTPIDWTKTQDIVASSSNTEIPKLVKVVHDGVESVFHGNEASSNFDKATKFLNRNGYEAYNYIANLDQILANEVMARRPVLVGGDAGGTVAGHAWVCDGYYTKDFERKIMAYEIQYMANQNYQTSPYRSTLEKTKTVNMGKYFHMNWGWGLRYADYSDPATLSGNTVGWFRSVFEVEENQNLNVLQVVK